MKKSISLAILTAALAITASAIGGATPPAMKTHPFRCTDRNQSMYFVVYENNGALSKGHMYVENMQVAVLEPENAGTNVIKAKVVGNTATNIAFQLHKDGKVMVANYGSSPSRVEVCKASYKYQ